MPTETIIPSATKDHKASLLCSICCEENKPNLISLTKCSHASCKDCLVQWIERVEAISPTAEEEEKEVGAVVSLPGCPFCRASLTLEETNSILGRTFEPGRRCNNKGGIDTPSNGEEEEEEEMDELTLQLLLELGSKQCPRCGAWIEKLQGGCDMMECLCGCRFCYGCGTLNARCNCTPATHNFWDNILDRNAWSTPAHEEAPLTADGDRIDLMTHIRNRKKKDQDEQIRQNRIEQRITREQECETVDELTYSAKWLFLSTTTKSLRVLNQILAKNRFPQIPQWFLFRGWRNEEWACDELVSSARWLFLPVKGAFKVLEQQKDNSVHYKRKHALENRCREAEQQHHTDTSARWLFCENVRKTGFRMLQEQEKADRVRHHREYQRAEQQELSISKVDRLIACGSGWLYRKKTPQDTYQHLKRLLQHEQAARSARVELDWFGSREAAARADRGEPDVETQEKENAETLRLFFCS